MLERHIRNIFDSVRQQNEWRMKTINLIASENIVSKTVSKLSGSDFAHRYAEGHPGERYYQGTEYIDKIESDLRNDFKTLFRSARADVRPISGTNANEAVFSSFINPGDIVMVNSTPGGGHISHHLAGSVGKFTKNVIDFPLAADGFHIDVDRAKDLIRICKPKMLIFGKSLFLFPEPVHEFRDICNEYKIHIVYDAAHVLGLISGGKFQDPFSEGVFIMTGSTHKTFFGTQRGVILSNMGMIDWQKVDKGAFPGSSSNHHLDTLVGLAVATQEMISFGKGYSGQVVINARALGKALHRKGFKVMAQEYDFTESHQVAVDVKDYGGGKMVANLLKENDIILNMNILPHEPLRNVTNPDGIRIGVQEMTRVGMKEEEMDRIAAFIAECILQGQEVREEVNRLRKDYAEVCFSFDEILTDLQSPNIFS
ncbi:MAG TPA: aminotransferase class I/II-fold pyridoxal phosphate-dependent enzyme [Spirochaetes bacterium]|nr:aminotransferase class I/II-fold pyridoxal phosphate-dependent enzyme [Spirochaetota bacterium]